ncbi:MAG: hypothetical protein RLZZ352_1682 [Pseudomonadota bacterium]|jgi:LruC domain-containing protein
MKTALRTGAVAATALLATATLTGFTTIKIGDPQRINWLYERASAAPESGTGDKVKLNFGDYASNPAGTAAGTAFDTKDGLPAEKPGVFSLRGARGAGSTSTSMPGLNDLLTKTHTAVTGTATSGTYNSTTKNADLSALSAVVPNTFAASVAKALPEGKNILDNPTFKPVADEQANLIMKDGKAATRVWASFVMEGAGHKNSFGYFIYDPLCPPKHRNQVQAFDGNTAIKTVPIFDPANTAAKNQTVYLQGNADSTRNYVEKRTDESDTAPIETRSCKPRAGTTREIIVLPNASQDLPLPRAGSTNASINTSGTGPTAYLGEIPTGMAMGFVVVSNGWTQTGSNTNTPGTSKSQNTEWIFYSLSALNPELRGQQTVGTRTYDDLTKHVILLKDGNLENYATGYHRFALGFEDLNRNNASADNDFNDLVMMLHVEKKDSLSNVKVAATPTDVVTTDVVVKSVTDTSTSSVVHYPSATTWATLAFEDLWPAAPSGFFYNSVTATQADYDFNDLVVKYRSSQTLVNDRITQIDLTYRLDARGARIKSGFAVQLRGLKQSEIESIRVTDPSSVPTTLKPSDAYKLAAPALGAYVGPNNVNNATAVNKAVDSGNNQVTIRLFNNAFEWLPEFTNYAIDDCNKFYNTYRKCSVEDSKTFTVQIKFLGTGVAKVGGPTPPYNPYIFNFDSPTKEVHLPNQQPTQFGKDNSSFGTLQDVTDKANWSKTYVTADGRPWAVHIPYEWDHPQESNRIGDVFSGFKPWVESKGVSNTDWYTKPTVANTFRGTRKFPK